MQLCILWVHSLHRKCSPLALRTAVPNGRYLLWDVSCYSVWIAYPHSRYEHVYAFTDRQQRLFTVTNVPYDLCLPSGPNLNLETNKTYHEMRRPQFAADTIPEAAFLTRTVPVTDSLLSCVAADDLEPERYAGGYRVPASIQKSWIELEKGLMVITGVLRQGISSRVLASVMGGYLSWPKPSEWNFRGLHPHYEAAQGVARRTRTSLLFLAARCSMAIAVWEHEHPAGSIGATPAWIAELEKECVASSWRDAIQQSVVSQFSAGLRVGAIFQVGISYWFELIPILRASCVPVFFCWQSQQDIAFINATHPYLSDFTAAVNQDRLLACQLPPTRDRPPVYRLVRNGIARNHPDMTVTPHEIPRGPYQHPEESRNAFIARRKKLSTELQWREDAGASERRLQRERWATSEPLPRRMAGVYVWTSVEQAYPHYPENWHAVEIRVPVPGRAVLGLWRSVPARDRSYNSFFDEWDLWFSAARDAEQDQAISAALHPPSPDLDLAPPARDILPYDMRAQAGAGSTSTALSGLQPTDLEELESLQHVAERNNSSTPLFNLDDIQLWYGVCPTPRAFDGVNYDTYLDQVQFVFGRPSATMPQDPLLLRSLSGWISAMSSHQLDSDILADTWDLDSRSSTFLLKIRNVCRVRLHEHGWLEADGHERVLYDITFDRDPNNLAWRLIAGAAAIVFLLRHADVVDSQGAVHTLLCYGIPFHTGTMSSCLAQQQSLSLLRSRSFAPYRSKSFTPTARDYSDYAQRVLEIVRRPQAAAGFRMGGIIWRLLVEVVRDDTDLRNRLEQQAGSGPSGEPSVYQEVLQLSPSFAFVDDSLSEEELDIISGVYRVYTGK